MVQGDGIDDEADHVGKLYPSLIVAALPSMSIIQHAVKARNKVLDNPAAQPKPAYDAAPAYRLSPVRRAYTHQTGPEWLRRT
jgi:hypothetical protein